MLASTPVNMALTQSVSHCMSLNVSDRRAFTHEEVRVEATVELRETSLLGFFIQLLFLLTWAIIVHFSSFSRAQSLCILFAVRLIPLLQEEEFTYWLHFFSLQ